MATPVTIDTNAWDYLFRAKVCLTKELPPDIFTLFITREVEIEIERIPEIGKDGSDKRELKEYIRQSIQSHGVKTTAVFGFSEGNEAGGPSRYAGFGQGTFMSQQERDWRKRDETKKFLSTKTQRPTSLIKNEADVSVAISSLRSILITGDKKAGPIADAAANGGRVIYLHEVELSGLSLGEFIAERLLADG